jgi:hypothetical protein
MPASDPARDDGAASRRGFLAAAALAAFASALPGCNIVAPALYAVDGPGKIPAEHELAEVRTVVFVDDRRNVFPRTALRTSIGEAIAKDLLGRKLVPSIVSPRDAIALARQKESGTKPLSISAIGRELDAQQVLYVQVVSFLLAGDGESDGSGVGVRPTANCRVKVIDCVANTRTYPIGDIGESGRLVTSRIREVDPEAFRTVASRRAVEDRLAARVAIDVAELFYEHDRVDLGQNLGTR